MSAFWRDVLRGIEDLLLPTVCASCGTDVDATRVFCTVCDARRPRLPLGTCVRCGTAPAGPASETCAACRAVASPLAACIAAAPFRGEIADWIHRFKYPRPGLLGLDPAASAVARLLIREAASRAPGPPPRRVVPVPLHPRRLRARGFNPAALLAHEAARTRGVPWAPRALERVRDTPSQTGFERRLRRRNVAGAFRARGDSDIAGRVWLVDDVVTTGATLEEAARALRRAGAEEVVAVCAARTPWDR